MTDEVLQFITMKVREATGSPERLNGNATQIYYDARIWGEDFYELIDCLIEKYSTDFSAMDASKFVPPEGFDPRQLLERCGKRPWRSLTIDDLARAVGVGFWAQARVW